MHLGYNILPIYLLLEVSSSKRNLYFPPRGGHYHYSDIGMHHDDNYQPYDSSSSYSTEEIVLRQAQYPRWSKYRRNFDHSDSEYNYKCKCSCTKCLKRKPKTCCKNFCSTACNVQNNILVVPYPVPFMVYNQSATVTIYTPPHTTTTTTTQTEPPTQTAPPTISTVPSTSPTSIRTLSPRKTLPNTYSTQIYYDKRFRIINENKMRRNMGNNGLRSPKFGRLPRYGIVPLPDNIALSLMQQLKRDQLLNDQFRKRLSVNKNSIDYAGLNFV